MNNDSIKLINRIIDYRYKLNVQNIPDENRVLYLTKGESEIFGELNIKGFTQVITNDENLLKW